jgi:hypothetical protein
MEIDGAARAAERSHRGGGHSEPIEWYDRYTGVKTAPRRPSMYIGISALAVVLLIVLLVILL